MKKILFLILSIFSFSLVESKNMSYEEFKKTMLANMDRTDSLELSCALLESLLRIQYQRYLSGNFQVPTEDVNDDIEDLYDDMGRDLGDSDSDDRVQAIKSAAGIELEPGDVLEVRMPGQDDTYRFDSARPSVTRSLYDYKVEPEYDYSVEPEDADSDLEN